MDRLRVLRPTKIYVSSDGPRSKADERRILLCREAISRIDWGAQVVYFYHEKNLGMYDAFAVALDYILSRESGVIILEDDCLPCFDFFVFCEKLLTFYANDHRVWVISGNNFQDGIKRGEYSYFFSKYPHSWGWATWRRAWKHYNGNIPFWNNWKLTEDWKQHTPDKIERSYWEKIFDRVYSGEDTYAYDYAWIANIWFHKGLGIVPNVNLVTNIGHDEQASMTKSKNVKIANVKIEKLDEILKHPKIVKRNVEADIYDFNHAFEGLNLRFPRNFLIKIKILLMVFVKKIIDLLKFNFTNFFLVIAIL